MNLFSCANMFEICLRLVALCEKELKDFTLPQIDAEKLS